MVIAERMSLFTSEAREEGVYTLFRASEVNMVPYICFNYMPQPKIAIIYLSFHCEPYIDDVMSALKKLTYPKDKLAFVVVDNPHPEYGSSIR